MDVFDLVAKITLDSSEYEKELDKQANENGIISKLSKGLGKVGKAGAVAFGAVGAAATAAAGVIVKSAVSGYAEFEQLEGGVKKLFGEESAKTVMNYAENAYKTAGMSANEYMETATSFSASLIQSLGNDTAKAADVADVAMRAMSDNVSTFGTDIESVKTAYAGFAKQNYTMLDNLKLGYGGTKSEMERLIKDANKYRKAQGKNADLTVDSFADIIEAIQTVQEEQGIAGTTADEAMRTIQGSADATKAAWQNVLTAIAGGGNLKKAMKGLTESIFGTGGDTGLLNQVIPRVQTAFEGLADFIGQAAPLFAAKLPELITAILPSAISAITSLATSLASALPGVLGAIWDSIRAAAPTVIEAVQTAIAGIPGALGGIIDSITTWASENGGSVLAQAQTVFDNIITAVSTAIDALPGALGGIATAIGGWVTEHGEEILANGENLFNWIVAGIKTGIDKIGEWIGGIIDNIIDWVNGDGGTEAEAQGKALWEKIKEGFTNGLDSVKQLAAKIVTGIVSWFTENYASIAEAGKNILTYIVDGIVAVASDIGRGLLSMIGEGIAWLWANKDSILSIGKSILTFIVQGIIALVGEVGKGIAEIISNIGAWIRGHGEDIMAFGQNILNWIVTGIKKFIGDIVNGFVNLPATILEGITGLSYDDVGGGLIGKMKDAAENKLDDIKAAFTGLPGKIKEKIDGLSFASVGSAISTGIKNSFTGIVGLAGKIIGFIQEAVRTAGAQTYTTTVHVTASGETAGGGGGTFAKAKNRPYLFTKATVFGRYNGEDLIAGEAGPEMLLGVNKLNAMLYQSVQGGMSTLMSQMQGMLSQMQGGGSVALQQEIINVLNAYLPQLANQQVVLDTGAIAGAVAPGVDSALGGTAGHKRRYNA